MNEELEELKSSKEEEDSEEKETETKSAVWTLKTFGKLFWVPQTLKEKKNLDYNPVCSTALNPPCIITETLEPL